MKLEIKDEFHSELRTMDSDLARLKIAFANIELDRVRTEQQKAQLAALIRDKDRIMLERLKEIAKEHDLDLTKNSWSFNIGDMSFTEVSA